MMRATLAMALAFVAARPLRAQTRLHTIHGATASEGAGDSIDRVGDVNGGGVADFAVGSPGDFLNPAAEFGHARVYSGLDRSLLHEFHGDNHADEFGQVVAGIGDVDADGLADLAVGAVWADGGGGPAPTSERSTSTPAPAARSSSTSPATSSSTTSDSRSTRSGT